MHDSHHFIDNIVSLGFDEKLDIVRQIGEKACISSSDLELLNVLSNDDESEVRYRVAEVLVISDSTIAEEILMKLVHDKDELVRVNACDSLCISKSVDVLNLLKNRVVKDRSKMVRGYAALSIADMSCEMDVDKLELRQLIKDALDKESNEWLKNNYYYALCVLGDNSYFELLLNQLDDRSYRNRCSAANLLKDLAKKENKTLLMDSFMNRLQKEKTRAVTSSIENAIEKIKNL